jgi:hypothetical protein
MKMTKRFEKKLKALADKMGLDTNFDWDLGWFDFLTKDLIKLGCVRFYGYGMNTKRKLQIYVATAYTKICYYENGSKWNGYGWGAVQNRLLIWDPATPGHIKTAEDGTTHETLIFNDENEPTEEIILGFLEASFTHCMRARFLEKEKERLKAMREDF